MAKYLVETYYTCSFKISHYLDDINEKEMKNLEKRDDGNFEILEQRIIGEKHLKCTLKLIGASAIFEGIAFFQEKLKTKQVRVAYRLNVNSFRGNESLQLMIESIEH